jgi:predicted dehydrogenase
MNGGQNINATIIGVGSRGMIYMNLCLSGISGNVQVIAAADPNLDRMRFLIGNLYKDRNIEMPRLYKDYREMINKEKIDLVFICSDNITHKRIFNDVMNKNVHIMMEKPLATTINET